MKQDAHIVWISFFVVGLHQFKWELNGDAAAVALRQLQIVEFIDDIRNPTGIYKFVDEYAQKNGTQHKKVVEFVNNKTGETWEKEVNDYYEPNDPEEYVMVLIDHISLISTEKKNGVQLIKDFKIDIEKDKFKG